MNNFMVNLKRFYALEYVLVPTKKAADAALFQCEKRYNWDMLHRSREKPKGICPVVENKSMLRNKSNDRAAMVFEVNANGKCVITECLYVDIGYYNGSFYRFQAVLEQNVVYF